MYQRDNFFIFLTLGPKKITLLSVPCVEITKVGGWLRAPLASGSWEARGIPGRSHHISRWGPGAALAPPGGARLIPTGIARGDNVEYIQKIKKR